ncbi:unnamed protein product [Mytilus edulis]|uniref:Tyrosine-protein kinase ephrin type A/B receptor-like domain-containing protein n=1 Tax=Mytilus edulis TaxID=6550 RepID=A0A8S3RJ56_MYTED|nr:unnamed protein product [Mytilus edulis]
MVVPLMLKLKLFANLTQNNTGSPKRLKKAIHVGRISIDMGQQHYFARDCACILYSGKRNAMKEPVLTWNRQGCVVSNVLGCRVNDKTCISCPRVACSPGSWSADGIPPCSYCPKGTYQDIYGGNKCEICPNSTTTELDGATDVKHCIGRGFTGRISQLNIFDKDTELLPFKSCLNNEMGNILSWKDFEDLVAPDIIIDVPSDCDVDGEWGEWGNWSSCSLTCGYGTMTRVRHCNSPSPDNGGSYCIGNNSEYDTCMDEECLGTYVTT